MWHEVATGCFYAILWPRSPNGAGQFMRLERPRPGGLCARDGESGVKPGSYSLGLRVRIVSIFFGAAPD